MEYSFSSFNIVDKFLAATDQLLGFTEPKNSDGIETEQLAKILKKYCPDKWYTEEYDECE
jgi:hypothetical protein